MMRLAHMVRDSRGAAIIEFALVLPVLVLFVYGTFVVGQLF
jgi:Flp pilus assembly protein TadG